MREPPSCCCRETLHCRMARLRNGGGVTGWKCECACNMSRPLSATRRRSANECSSCEGAPESVVQ